MGHFLGGANNFFLPKLNPVLPKRYPLRGGQVLQFCSAKLMYHPFVSHCSASLKIGQKLLNDGSKTGKNGSKIGKYMAETKQKWLQTDKLGRKIYKVWRKRAMLAMFCFCTFCFPILFCQTDNFSSAKPPNALLPS